MLEGGACEHILVDGNKERTEPPGTTMTIGDADIVIPDTATDAGAVDVQASEVKSGTTVTTAASTPAVDATFIAAISIADVVAIAAPSAVKILITTLADDDPAFIGGVIQHSSSKISKASFPVDDLANVVNTVPKAIGPFNVCLLYTSPSPRDGLLSRMPSSA